MSRSSFKGHRRSLSLKVLWEKDNRYPLIIFTAQDGSSGSLRNLPHAKAEFQRELSSLKQKLAVGFSLEKQQKKYSPMDAKLTTHQDHAEVHRLTAPQDQVHSAVANERRSSPT